MSPRRMFRELAVFGFVVGSTVVGYSAGAESTPTAQLVLAFLGMALGGVFAELCLIRR